MERQIEYVGKVGRQINRSIDSYIEIGKWRDIRQIDGWVGRSMDRQIDQIDEKIDRRIDRYTRLIE